MITVYFWWRNTKGLHESSDDALRIMKITTVMVVILILWCVLTLLERGGSAAAGADCRATCISRTSRSAG